MASYLHFSHSPFTNAGYFWGINKDDATLLGSGENPKLEGSREDVLFPTKSKPNQINRGSGPDEEAAEKEVMVGMQPVIESKANATPDQQARDQVAHDRPERALFII